MYQEKSLHTGRGKRRKPTRPAFNYRYIYQKNSVQVDCRPRKNRPLGLCRRSVYKKCNLIFGFGCAQLGSIPAGAFDSLAGSESLAGSHPGLRPAAGAHACQWMRLWANQFLYNFEITSLNGRNDSFIISSVPKQEYLIERGPKHIRVYPPVHRAPTTS